VVPRLLPDADFRRDLVDPERGDHGFPGAGAGAVLPQPSPDAGHGQHQWYTVQGGSIEYVTRLEMAMRAPGVDIRLAAPIDAVRARPAGSR
jgi:phytoene dehydrogenase-like protein